MGTPDDTNRPAPTTLVGAHWPGTLMERMGMEVVEHSASRTVVTAPVGGNRQSAGVLHGGASAALAGAERAVGTELSVSHLRVAREGTVTAVATAVHLGGTSTVHLVEVRDEGGRLVASARVTNRLLGGTAPH